MTSVVSPTPAPSYGSASPEQRSCWSNWGRESFTTANSDSFFDAASDVSSFRSSSSSLTGLEGFGDSSSKTEGKINADRRHKDLEEKFQQEHKCRTEAEALADKLVHEKAVLEAQLQRLEQRIQELQQVEEKPNPIVGDHDDRAHPSYNSDQEVVVVARLVSSIVTRLVSKDEAERKWAAEVQLLRQRVERSAAMQSMVENLRNQQRSKQELERRKYLQTCMAVTGLGLGLLGVSVVARYVQR